MNDNTFSAFFAIGLGLGMICSCILIGGLTATHHDVEIYDTRDVEPIKSKIKSDVIKPKPITLDEQYQECVKANEFWMDFDKSNK